MQSAEIGPVKSEFLTQKKQTGAAPLRGVVETQKALSYEAPRGWTVLTTVRRMFLKNEGSDVGIRSPLISEIFWRNRSDFFINDIASRSFMSRAASSSWSARAIMRAISEALSVDDGKESIMEGNRRPKTAKRHG